MSRCSCNECSQKFLTSPEYWMEVNNFEEKYPTGNICFAYYTGDRPVEGNWIFVKEIIYEKL